MRIRFALCGHDDDDFDDFKTIGIFSSQEKANKAIERLKSQPGFRNYPKQFHIDEYEVDETCWVEGFGFD